MSTNDEREQQVGLDDDHPMRRIEEDHCTLRGQLDAVAAATTPSLLLSCLLSLPKLMQEHFALEEEPDGLYADLTARCPSLAGKLDALRDEHRVILAEFEELCRKIKVRIDAQGTIEEIAEPMVRDVARWLERLQRHEHEESRMIGDVYYSDEGGHG